ncbi:MAG: GntR family transcriptional regulator [Balneolaceae bacterium]
MNTYKQPIPKYYQIYEKLLKQIREGTFDENDRFPSDTELVRQFDVSRGTVREAVKLLLQQGYLIREQGKGTFVTYKKIEQEPDKLIGFSELMRKHNIRPAARIVEKEVINPSGYLKKLMHLGDQDQLVRLVRIRYGDGQPLIVERSYFNYRLFKPIYSSDLEQNSIFSLLYQKTSTRLGEATQRIEAISAGESEHKMLNVSLGTPLLLIKRLIQTKSGDYFQYSEDVYRSDRINFATRTVPYEDDHTGAGLPLDLVNQDW